MKVIKRTHKHSRLAKMLIWLKIITKFIDALRSGDSPGQIGAGFGIGFIIGLMPFLTLQTIFFVFVLVLFNINLAAGMVAVLLANIFAFLFDPLFHSLGYYLLSLPALHGFWTMLYNHPAGQLTNFYHTITIGSFLGGLIAFFPAYFGMYKFVVVYREKLEERIKKLKIYKMVMGSKIVQWYFKVSEFV